MKNLFFIAIATMMALSSCSENEVFTTSENSKTPITIDVYQQGQTRVTETTITDLQNGFKFVVMNGTETVIDATASYSDSKWSYDGTPAYWPADGSDPTYKFYGFYSPNTADELDIANNQVTVNVDGVSDVVFASVPSSKPTTDGAAVALPFKHLMAEVVVSAKGMNDGLNYAVTKVTFSAPETVYYDLTSSNWSRGDLEKDLTFLNNATGVRAPYHATNYTALADANMLILPAYEMTMTITYNVSAAGETTPRPLTRTATITPTAGSVNRINVTLPSERTPISFSVSLDGWSATTNNITDPTLN